ncbi:MAG TPA: hypothetical protein VGA37_01750 [Gemmatimonadales bacterium]
MRNHVLILLASCCACPALSQELPAGARLPLQHWSVPFLEHLARTGAIVDPTPLMRPWRVADIATALERADTTRLGRADRGTRRQILNALQARSSERGIIGGGDVGVVVSTHQRRPEFSLRHTGSDRVSPEVSGLFGFWFGPALLILQVRYDEDLEDDPDWAGVLGQAEVGTDWGYGAYRSKYLDIELGNLSRNWGPPGFPGLLVSDWPLSYDHLFVELGPSRLHLNMLVTQLDDVPDRNGELSRRFFLAHRLEARVTSWLDLALWQGTILSGPNRNLEIWYLNPFQPTYFARNKQGQQGGVNFMFGGEGQMRVGRVHLTGGAFFDDFDVQLGEPPALGFTGTATTPIGGTSLWLGYTLVSNLAYRTNDPAEKALVALDPDRGRFGTGLARNFADYDQVSAKLTLVPLPGVIMAPEVTFLRQGEGDQRLPYPSRAEFDTTRTIFVGVVERTLRAALVSTIRLPLGITASLDVAMHRVANLQHQIGASETSFVGTGVLRWGFWSGGSLD